MIHKPPDKHLLRGMTRLEIVVTVVLVLMCTGLVGLWPGIAFFLLLFGWIIYPFQAADELTIEWVSVATACCALLLFAAGVHSFGKWLAAEKSTSQKPRSWTFRNSLQTVLLILFAFLAGTSMIGIVHQVVWLATTEEKLLSGGRTAARRSISKNHLKMLGLAHHNYHNAHDSFAVSTFSEDGKVWHSWQTYLLPFVDQKPLYEQIDQNRSWTDPANREHFSTAIPVYQNPGIGDDREEHAGHPSPSHYAGNIRLLRPNQKASLETITDGSMNTLLGGEVDSRFKPWGDPTNLRDPASGINRSPTGFGGPYVGGANMLFADGSVRFLSERTDPAILKALATPSGKEEISDGAY